MTETLDQVAWVREDPELVERLDENWTGWDDPGADGLVATLDKESDWSGWQTWSDDDKRSLLATTLDTWYPPDRVAWIREDPDLVARLDANWAGWADAGDAGLVATLDQESDWSGWDAWSDDDKRSFLATTLDTWYPPDRVGWARENTELAARLDANWAGWDDTGADGLAATLDQENDWSGWETWSDDDKRSYLAQTLDVWYPPETADEDLVAETVTETETAEPAGEAPLEPLEAAVVDEVLSPVLEEALADEEFDFDPADLEDPEVQEMLERLLAEELGRAG